MQEDKREMLLAHVGRGEHLNVALHGCPSFEAQMRALQYPATCIQDLVPADVWAVVFPEDGLQVSLLVDDQSKTLLLFGDGKIPVEVRGSPPSFALGQILPRSSVVHGFLFRGKDNLSDNSAETVKLALFDISEAEGEDFRSLAPDQRHARLRFLFGRAWYDMQHRAAMVLCKRLQQSRDAQKNALGQALLHAHGGGGWPAELLNDFAQYSWAPGGHYQPLVAGMCEMGNVVHPIPTHIQLFPVMPGGNCMDMRTEEAVALPGAPGWGGVMPLAATL